MIGFINGNKITHKGWYGFCPVYIAETAADAADWGPRSPLLEPLALLSQALMWLFNLEGCFLITEEYE